MIKEGDVVLCCGKYRLVHAVRSMGVYFKDFQRGKDLESAPALVNIKEVKELTHDDFLTIFNRVAGHDLIVGVGISETAFSRMYTLSLQILLNKEIVPKRGGFGTIFISAKIFSDAIVTGVRD